MARHLFLLPLLALLIQCTAPIKVKSLALTPPPTLPITQSASDWLLAINHSSNEIKAGKKSAIGDYNYACSRFIEQLTHDHINPWLSPTSLSANGQTYKITGSAPAYAKTQSATFLPTDRLSFQGEYVVARSLTQGLGAPIIVTNIDPHSNPLKSHTTNQPLYSQNFTAIVKIKGHDVNIDLVDPYQANSVQFANSSHTLSADYASAIMYSLSTVRVDKLGLIRLLKPGNYDNTARLSFTQPYDPSKTPVLFVHGLQDTPVSFTPMYFKLLADPEIRKHYQFWAFSYPSGYPYFYSASLLRRELDKVNQNYPGHKPITIVGHSMGGLVSRLMVTDANDQIWNHFFQNDFNQTPMNEHSKKLLKDSFIFTARKDINHAIFISTPHRGSILASNWVGRTASRLIKAPSLISDLSNQAFAVLTIDSTRLAMNKAPNSIDTLSPNNAFVQEINKIPISPKVPYHSIIGDRGKGDTPNSSDGVVAYWSSHLEKAKSEKIVPSNHSAHIHPDGIEEVHRILHENIRNSHH